MAATLEHTNLTVTNPEKTAQLLCELFDWHVRWSGPSMLGGRTVHVGTDERYLAVYTPDDTAPMQAGYATGSLNHIGVLVDDLDATEAKVKAAGFEPYNFGDYEPGRRFYFNDHDNIEFEVVSYS